MIGQVFSLRDSKYIVYCSARFEISFCPFHLVNLEVQTILRKQSILFVCITFKSELYHPDGAELIATITACLIGGLP